MAFIKSRRISLPPSLIFSLRPNVLSGQFAFLPKYPAFNFRDIHLLHFSFSPSHAKQIAWFVYIHIYSSIAFAIKTARTNTHGYS